ncbi:family 78 glycoside hydrolase catalytic domain [Arthrobacter burdickii]|uniref:alpha-L-rhamnosidase n=1 Tax=Arthrobacter burdickii TaxID=3035920 RepID=A0ABT8JY94_9MICC|nr:family 78 glycoside hydrolase catalytic domain [Arthrobacter burdickii]MDN4610143.1 family 78 glycoside hydrolase catalytic domain [Arthrobacter burdickii]
MTALTWSAAMIAPDEDFGGAPLLRKQFSLVEGHGAPTSAILRATSFGIYEATINGEPVGDDVLSPGWSSYEWRLRYRTYNVTALLQPTNVLGISLGNGWYRGNLGFNGNSAFYGTELAFFGQLNIEYADGFTQTISSDSTWEAGPSGITANDLYNGQSIDAGISGADWTEPGYDTSSWTGVHLVDFDYSRLAEPVSAPVVRNDVLQPASIHTSPSGKTLVDFGQNIVGWLRFTVQGEPGSVITLRHAEVLEDGELGTRPLRTALATDTITLSGDHDFFEPTKTFHGFRYVEVTGWPGDLTAESLEAVVVHTALERTGWFECSNPLVNKLHENVVWGLKGNFLDLPTDCPQRNERLGWTGDISVFTPTAAFLYDVKDFLQDWLLDVAVEQKAADGTVPFTVPDILKYEERPPYFPAPESAAIWGDAAVWVPWALWEAYADRSVLEQQYESMAAHARRVESLLSPTDLWDQGFQFGDWLDPDGPPDQPWISKADNGVVATACLYRTAGIMAQTASILGHADDAEHFTELADRVREAFNEHYVTAQGTILSDCTTVYALALAFEVLDDEKKRLFAGRRLAQLVAQNGYRVSTGFAGTPFITWALSEAGYVEDAYKLLLEEHCPSWLYPVTMGATTVWERWDSMLPDGTINPGEMTSFNHYALGAVADWLHKVVGGIRPLEPGYSKILFAPRPAPGIEWARTSLVTAHGTIRSEWRVFPDGDMELTVSVPEGTTAEVDLPTEARRVILPGHHTFKTPALHF